MSIDPEMRRKLEALTAGEKPLPDAILNAPASVQAIVKLRLVLEACINAKFLADDIKSEILTEATMLVRTAMRHELANEIILAIVRMTPIERTTEADENLIAFNLALIASNDKTQRESRAHEERLAELIVENLADLYPDTAKELTK